MNDFTAALQFNLHRTATITETRLLGELHTMAATHPDPEKILCAFRLLSASEPHRLPALLASLFEGRVVAVVNHLDTYYTAERVAAHHSKIGKTVRSC